jgi:Na+-driven multidrug efflux pump
MRKNCGVLYNRARFIVTLVMVPLIIIYAFADKILIGIGQDKEVSKVARIYVCVMIPGVWAMG